MSATAVTTAVISYLLASSPPFSRGFNVYDEETFAASTCEAARIETPVGVFASPNGKANTAGTEANPIDLATALANNGKVVPGQTLWLMEGTYRGSFSSELQGTEALSINVKPYPGKRVRMVSTRTSAGSGLTINGRWTHYYGIEVTSFDGNRVSSVDNSSSPSDITLHGGANILGPYNRVINFISHDNASGIDAWYKSQDGHSNVNTEIYGSIIYNNGWSAQPLDPETGTRYDKNGKLVYGRGHGHAIYTQNFDGIKKITNNIIFYGFGTGIHAYQTGKVVDINDPDKIRGLENFDIQENVWFLTGASDIRKGMKKYDALVGGYQPVKNLIMKNNQSYSDIGRTKLGYASSYKGAPFSNESAVLGNNYFMQNIDIVGNWQKIDIKDSTAKTLSLSDNDIQLDLTNNILNSVNSPSEPESTQTINDLGGNRFDGFPRSGKKTFIVRNKYDPRRARVAIYNYDNDDTVAVDLSSILKPGEAYRIHSVFDLFGPPVVSGVYEEGDISIPMGTVAPPQPYGLNGAINADEGDDPKKLFGVFIITRAGC